nr:hypothetical protein [Tanacetum cinerariifolium]
MSISSDSDGLSWGIPLMNASEFLEMDPNEEVKHEDEDLEEDPSEEHEPKDDDEDPEEDPKEEHEPEDEDSDETEPFEKEETAVTPPPPRQCGARISVRPQTPMAASTQALIDAFSTGSSPFPLPPTSPAYDHAPLVEEGKGLIRSPGQDARTIARVANRAEDVGYVKALQASERRMKTSIKEVNLKTGRKDIRLEIDVVKGQRTTYETELQEPQRAEDLAVTQMMRIHILEARARTDTVEDPDSS